MYLSKIKIVNFRIFGDETENKHAEIKFHPQVNLIVGENDSGKSAVIDAIRILLGTRDNEWPRLSHDDFHRYLTTLTLLRPSTPEISTESEGDVINSDESTESHIEEFQEHSVKTANTLTIEGIFEDLSDDEASMFLEWLGVRQENGQRRFFLKVWLTAKYRSPENFDGQIFANIKAGPDDEGVNFDIEARNRLRATYLRPLRDAQKELIARRGSRLSQIMYARILDDDTSSQGLMALANSANERLVTHDAIGEPVQNLNTDYFSKMMLHDNQLMPKVGITSPELRKILEDLHLYLVHSETSRLETTHGMGINSVLFMAAELLLLKSQQKLLLALLLIEEPEAHLHPQLQLNLVRFLLTEQTEVQVIMTSHSSSIAAQIGLEQLILVKDGQVFPMGSDYTKLQKEDYAFLEKFLDTTRADLFFARGVLIVEGDAEHILLPVIADLLERPFEKYGVTIVNVGHVGLFRYARIFQRVDGKDIRVKVACVTDNDIPPDEATYIPPERKKASGYTKEKMEALREKKASRAGSLTFISEQWTLEYDVCLFGYALEMHVAVQLSCFLKRKHVQADKARKDKIFTECKIQYDEWVSEGKTPKEIAALIYEPLHNKKASKPDTAYYFAGILRDLHNAGESSLQFSMKLPSYLVEAIEYVTESLG